MGHAHTLYAEQLDIPLIFSGPNIPKAKINHTVGLSDIAPTLAAMTHIETPKKYGSKSVPAMNGNTLSEKNWFAETSRFNTNRLSVKQGTFRLEWDLAKDKAELFNQVKDPNENRDVSLQHPDTVKELKQKIIAVIGQKAWTVKQDGTIYVSKGALIDDKLLQSQTYKTGDGFSVWPVDARVRHQSDGSTTVNGPFTILGPQQPKSTDPLGLLSQQSNQVELGVEVKKRLDKMGYMQAD